MEFLVKIGFAGMSVSLSGLLLKTLTDDSLLDHAGPFSRSFESLSKTVSDASPTLFFISLLVFLAGLASLYGTHLGDGLDNTDTSEEDQRESARQPQIDTSIATLNAKPQNNSTVTATRKIFI